jgi:glycosyltransferase involved in cell wall biosynthesis
MSLNNGPIGRVLIPSDNRDWVVNFARAYRRLGYEITTGTYNFDLEGSHPDIVHFQWPEELTGWKLPTASQIDEISARLDRWAQRARLIISVNNLYPHAQYGNPLWHRLYTAFYERAEVIHHFSHASKQAVCSEFPTIAGRNHVVRLGFNYDLLLPSARCDRAESRRTLGFAPNETVYLVFGSLRFWTEVQTIQQAFSRARVRNKRLLMAGRYVGSGGSWTARWRRWRWQQWQRWNNVRRVIEYVPDSQVHQLFEAADAVVVVRQNSLSSGVPSLAMTFGKMVIGPNCGGIPEYLAGADNLLYEPDSYISLASAMERAAVADREEIGTTNRQIAAAWDWQSIISACLDGLPAGRHRKVVTSLTA